jgi:predicted methyltransferase
MSFPRKRESSNKFALAMNRFLSIAVAVLIANTAAAQGNSVPTYISKAVDNSSRPQTDRDRDENRRPAEVIAFADIKPGDIVVDLMPGGGYFTRIFCNVVGEKGRVYAVTVSRKTSAASSSSSTPSASLSSQTSSSSSASSSCNNINRITLLPRNMPSPELHSDSDDPGWVYEYYRQSPAAENFATPEMLDVIWTSENYHDLHNAAFGAPDMLKVNKAFYAALKHNGVLIIEDHAAQAGSGARDTQTFHRIDPELVKREVLSAGFIFVGESTVLHHADDHHTTKAHDMHDKTDRFLLKFKRP